MIRARRLTHRYVFFFLAFFVPALLFVGLAFRPEAPTHFMPNPTLLTKAGFATITPDQVTQVQAGEQTFEIAVVEGPANTSFIIIRSVNPLLKPDLLVYWTPEANRNHSLPENAILLGELMGQSYRRMALPNGTPTDRGTLIMYSLGHEEVFAQFPLPNVVRAEKGARA